MQSWIRGVSDLITPRSFEPEYFVTAGFAAFDRPTVLCSSKETLSQAPHMRYVLPDTMPVTTLDTTLDTIRDTTLATTLDTTPGAKRGKTARRDMRHVTWHYTRHRGDSRGISIWEITLHVVKTLFLTSSLRWIGRSMLWRDPGTVGA